jgi:hypothetical protein
MAVCQNLVPLVNIKIAGKWMFIPLKMVLIGIDPYPHVVTRSGFILIVTMVVPVTICYARCVTSEPRKPQASTAARFLDGGGILFRTFGMPQVLTSQARRMELTVE